MAPKQKSRNFGGGVITGDADVVDRAVDELELVRAQQRAVVERWGAGGVAAGGRMTRLCNAFPTLRGVPGTDPWNAMRFLEWLCASGAVTGGSRHAGRFVLQVWNASDDWGALAGAPVAEGGLGLKGVELLPFNVVDALASWDSDHTRAFRDWVELPFWP
jgi:hypothetical protein